MKVFVLAGLFTAAMAPLAAASEITAECQLDETRRAQQVRIDSGAPGGSAPQAARPARETTPRSEEARASERQAAEAARSFAERRRSVKRIPDAELIGPRGAL
jgi:hypothetical protein